MSPFCVKRVKESYTRYILTLQSCTIANLFQPTPGGEDRATAKGMPLHLPYSLFLRDGGAPIVLPGRFAHITHTHTHTQTQPIIFSKTE